MRPWRCVKCGGTGPDMETCLCDNCARASGRGGDEILAWARGLTLEVKVDPFRIEPTEGDRRKAHDLAKGAELLAAYRALRAKMTPCVRPSISSLTEAAAECDFWLAAQVIDP